MSEYNDILNNTDETNIIDNNDSFNNLLNEIAEEKQQYDAPSEPEPSIDALAEQSEDEQINNSVVDVVAAKAEAKFLTNSIDRIMSFSLGMIAQDEETDFGADDEEKSEIQSYLYQCCKGHKNMPSWLQATITILTVYGLKAKDALQIRKQRKQIAIQEQQIKELKLKNDLLQNQLNQNKETQPSNLSAEENE